MLNEKSVLNVDSHSFQPFNLPFQTSVVIRVNLPILISNYVFFNRESLEKIEKKLPKRKSIDKN